MVVLNNSGSFKKVETGFYPGVITSVSPVQLDENNDGYYHMFVDWKPLNYDDVPFEINKRVRYKEETDFILKRVFTAAGLSGELNEDDKLYFNEKDLVGKEVLALCYQDNYVNIFDFLPMDANTEDKNKMLKRYEQYITRYVKKNVSDEAVTKVDDNKDVTEDNDLPF